MSKEEMIYEAQASYLLKNYAFMAFERMLEMKWRLASFGE